LQVALAGVTAVYIPHHTDSEGDDDEQNAKDYEFYRIAVGHGGPRLCFLAVYPSFRQNG
jgi:hypothetical protein